MDADRALSMNRQTQTLARMLPADEEDRFKVDYA
jgi:hypothetical protein